MWVVLHDWMHNIALSVVTEWSKVFVVVPYPPMV